MNNRVGAFCELLRDLHSRHARLLRASSELRELNDRVSRIFKVIGQQKMGLLSMTIKAGGSVKFNARDGYLFLPPLDQERLSLPVLNMDIDLGQSKLSVRIALFTLDQAGGLAAIGSGLKKEKVGTTTFMHN